MKRRLLIVMTWLMAGTCSITYAQAGLTGEGLAAQTPATTQSQPQAQPKAGPAETPALATLKAKAEAGDVASANKLGDMYGIGSGVPRNLAWQQSGSVSLRKAGIPLPGEDRPDVPGWFRCAARREGGVELVQQVCSARNEEAMLQLARLYESGTDVQKDVRESLKWYHKRGTR